MNAKFKYLFHFLLTFFLIFAPKLPYIYNSSFVAGLFALFVVILSKDRRKNLKKKLLSRHILFLITGSLVLSVISLLISVIHLTLDIYIIRTFLNQFFSLLSVLFVYECVRDETEYYVHKLVFNIFIAQSIIMILAFANSDVLAFVKLFQSKGILDRSHFYGGIRTMMLGTSAFFGLGATYGLVYVFYFKFLTTQNLLRYKHIIILSLLFAGTLFVARTGLIGFVFGFIVYLISTKKHSIFLFFKKTMITLAFFFCISIFFLPKSFINEFTNKIVPFAFEMFQKKGMQTNSTDGLLDMYKREINAKILICGEGKYRNDDGSYYKHTDAGYLRNLFFGGIPFFTLLLFYQTCMVFLPYKKLHYKDFLFPLMILFYILIIHIKGEVIYFARVFMITLFYFLLSIYNFKLNNHENITNNK